MRRAHRARALPLAPTLLLLAGLGCATAGVPLPEVDLSGPGWTVWTGQALWRPGARRPALAGELIVARRDDGDVLVSFSKPPLPLFTAQTSGGRWRIDFVAKGRAYGGRGRPPKRFVWFRLPEILAGAPAPPRWEVGRPADGEWTLVHRGRGETIRLVLDPPSGEDG